MHCENRSAIQFELRVNGLRGAPGYGGGGQKNIEHISQSKFDD